MKKLLFFLLTGFALQPAVAQSLQPDVIATSGTSFNNGTTQLDFTLGEPVTATLTAGSSTLTQGFHQPNLLITSVEDSQTAYTVTVFPNPTVDNVQLQFKNITENLTVELFSADGKLLESQKTNAGNNLQFNMSSYAAGTYLLSIKDSRSKNKTYRIVKSR